MEKPEIFIDFHRFSSIFGSNTWIPGMREALLSFAATCFVHSIHKRPRARTVCADGGAPPPRGSVAPRREQNRGFRPRSQLREAFLGGEGLVSRPFLARCAPRGAGMGRFRLRLDHEGHSDGGGELSQGRRVE